MFLTCFIVTHIELLTSDTSISAHASNFTGLQNAPLPRVVTNYYSTISSVYYLIPLDFSKQRNNISVRCDAFFK